jgi:hypothetical protein
MRIIKKQAPERQTGRNNPKIFSKKMWKLKSPWWKWEKSNASGNNARGKANTINEVKREAINTPDFTKGWMDEFSGAEIKEIKSAKMNAD